MTNNTNTIKKTYQEKLEDYERNKIIKGLKNFDPSNYLHISLEDMKKTVEDYMSELNKQGADTDIVMTNFLDNLWDLESLLDLKYRFITGYNDVTHIKRRNDNDNRDEIAKSNERCMMLLEEIDKKIKEEGEKNTKEKTDNIKNTTNTDVKNTVDEEKKVKETTLTDKEKESLEKKIIDEFSENNKKKIRASLQKILEEKTLETDEVEEIKKIIEKITRINKGISDEALWEKIFNMFEIEEVDKAESVDNDLEINILDLESKIDLYTEMKAVEAFEKKQCDLHEEHMFEKNGKKKRQWWKPKAIWNSAKRNLNRNARRSIIISEKKKLKKQVKKELKSGNLSIENLDRDIKNMRSALDENLVLQTEGVAENIEANDNLKDLLVKFANEVEPEKRNEILDEISKEIHNIKKLKGDNKERTLDKESLENSVAKITSKLQVIELNNLKLTLKLFDIGRLETEKMPERKSGKWAKKIMDLATRIKFIGRIVTPTTLALTIGLGVSLSRKASNILWPIIGGAAVGGVFRGVQAKAEMHDKITAKRLRDAQGLETYDSTDGGTKKQLDIIRALNDGKLENSASSIINSIESTSGGEQRKLIIDYIAKRELGRQLNTNFIIFKNLAKEEQEIMKAMINAIGLSEIQSIIASKNDDNSKLNKRKKELEEKIKNILSKEKSALRKESLKEGAKAFAIAGIAGAAFHEVNNIMGWNGSDTLSSKKPIGKEMTQLQHDNWIKNNPGKKLGVDFTEKTKTITKVIKKAVPAYRDPDTIRIIEAKKMKMPNYFGNGTKAYDGTELLTKKFGKDNFSISEMFGKTATDASGNGITISPQHLGSNGDIKGLIRAGNGEIFQVNINKDGTLALSDKLKARMFEKTGKKTKYLFKEVIIGKVSQNGKSFESISRVVGSGRMSGDGIKEVIKGKFHDAVPAVTKSVNIFNMDEIIPSEPGSDPILAGIAFGSKYKHLGEIAGARSESNDDPNRSINEPEIDDHGSINEPEIDDHGSINEPEIDEHGSINEPGIDNYESINEPEINGNELINEPENVDINLNKNIDLKRLNKSKKLKEKERDKVIKKIEKLNKISEKIRESLIKKNKLLKSLKQKYNTETKQNPSGKSAKKYKGKYDNLLKKFNIEKEKRGLIIDEKNINRKTLEYIKKEILEISEIMFNNKYRETSLNSQTLLESIKVSKEKIKKSIKSQKEYLEKSEITNLIKDGKIEGKIEKMDENCILSINLPAYKEGENIYNALKGYCIGQISPDGKDLDKSLFEINILLNRPNKNQPYDKKTEDEVNRFKKNNPDVRVNLLKRTYSFKDKKIEMGRIYKDLADIALYRNLKRKNSKTKARLAIRTGAADALEKKKTFLHSIMKNFVKDQNIARYKTESMLPSEILAKAPLIDVVYRLETGANRVYTRGNSAIGLGSYSAELYAKTGGFIEKYKVGEDTNMSLRMNSVITETEMVQKKEVKVNAIDDPRRMLMALYSGRLMADRYANFGKEEDKLRDENWSKKILNESLPQNIMLLKENIEKEVSRIFRIKLIYALGRGSDSVNKYIRKNKIRMRSKKAYKEIYRVIEEKVFTALFEELGIKKSEYRFVETARLDKARIEFTNIDWAIKIANEPASDKEKSTERFFQSIQNRFLKNSTKEEEKALNANVNRVVEKSIDEYKEELIGSADALIRNLIKNSKNNTLDGRLELENFIKTIKKEEYHNFEVEKYKKAIVSLEKLNSRLQKNKSLNLKPDIEKLIDFYKKTNDLEEGKKTENKKKQTKPSKSKVNQSTKRNNENIETEQVMIIDSSEILEKSTNPEIQKKILKAKSKKEKS